MVKIREVFEEQGYSNLKKRMFLSLLILAIGVIMFIIFMLLIYVPTCDDNTCFYNALANCKRVSWIREDAKAVWSYKILGPSTADNCRISVQLTKMKEGTIDTESLQGDKMTCTIQKDLVKYPEENMQYCTGVLKEDIQGIIIERMHSYLLKNLGEVKQGFGI